MDNTEGVTKMNYKAGKQFAWFVTPDKQHPEGKFHRSSKPMLNDEMMVMAAKHHWNHACYESVFQFPDWTGGRLDATTAKSAIIDRVFLDFDDKQDPLRAIREAGDVAALVGHSTTNFSGMKGAHVMIHCDPVDLIPDLKGSVLNRFAVELCENSGLTTMDIAVTGDLNRVHRIIDSKHPGSGLYAIGLSTKELLMLSMEEITSMAQDTREYVQRPEPSKWLTSTLQTIEEAIIKHRLQKLVDNKVLSTTSAYNLGVGIEENERKLAVWDFIQKFEAEVHRIQMKKIANLPKTSGGRSPEETWLLKVVEIFKTVHRAANIQPEGSKISTSASEHEARVHIVKLANDCSWTISEICDIFSGADDYDRKITEGQVRSILRG